MLLSLAFGVLVAVVIASLRAQSPAEKLQAEFEQLRDRTVEAAPTRPTHLQLADGSAGNPTGDEHALDRAVTPSWR